MPLVYVQMLADLSGLPVVSSVNVLETGQVLPQKGGNVNVYVGTPITVVFTVTDPNAGNVITASSSSLPSGATLTTTPSSGVAPVNVTFSWTPSATSPASAAAFWDATPRSPRTATYCLLISSNASLVSPTAECAGMDTVRRVDMVVDATCVQQKPKPITVVTVNGRVPQHNLQTIDYDGAEYGVLTIKRIDALFQSIPDNGLSVCLTFNKAPGSRCNSPQALFRGPTIVYQITSIDFMCCPTSEAPES
ncbi:hypothetical protein VOLCADRAFT_89111 [Volvox carteri f. nagariensis]|uniref:Pherophorin domain-containing protein n=1 Tax=Volvox carteri f. nagariensis TaxID=3068 RepID=D8TQU1_VOLCA|nr:uncharacterized protein VOLCADRAFT_89111 [Volvox carteri f. nagariensis]EFJ50092.1 hypothetical protein VOLCADRAFT_89111 [Volvox carteri f. nagariensis]|eukprot:XP_002948712.1 hypothetical protein VOLCADRAFT_89111 [Volvox carteri f. nagariensis]